MSLSGGTTLGPYAVVAPIGAGGMGEVYRARDSRLDRDVAVKVLPEHLAADSQALARFEREAKAVAALSHPNILAIHDFGVDKGLSYAVMELLEGETLGSRIQRAEIGWRKAVEMGIAIADGLAAAHSKGVVHRDLKPDNLFLTSDGRIKILDFGLAHRTPDPTSERGDEPTLSQQAAVMGTPGYMLPEQVRGIPADARSDIFSLGAVLYEMIARRRAFSGETAAQSMAAIMEIQPPKLNDSTRQVPPELDVVIAHCLEKNPQERFQSAQDLAFVLRMILGSIEAPKSLLQPAATRRRLAGWMAAAVAVLVLAAGILYLTRRSQAIDSLAVLPFVNVGADANQDYLSDGITEHLINSLSQLPHLRVVPRGIVFAYKGKEIDPQKVGHELNVRAILTGRVIQHGDRLNLQADLVDVSEISQLWGQQYDRKLADIITVQEDVARAVSDKLRLRTTAEEQRLLVRRSTQNAEAYQLYLKGLYYWNRRTGVGLKKAVDFFRQALEKDPGYALAYAGMAESYAMFSYYTVAPPAEAFPKAKAAAVKALEIDETVAEAHASLGWVKISYEWDWAGADREFGRALEIDPNHATARQWYAAYLVAMGRPDESLAAYRRALETEPLSLIISAMTGRGLYFLRRYDDAIDQLRKTLELDPSFAEAHLCLGLAYEQKGMYAEAIAALRQGLEDSGGEPRMAGALGHAYAVSGRRTDAEKILLQLTEQSRHRYVAPYDIAVVHLGLGNQRQAFDYLERAFDDHSHWLIFMRADPRFDSVRGDPRYQDLLRRMLLIP
jgi:serine/threonine protein kinase/tetratricopeptide (TPR) repeat protein